MNRREITARERAVAGLVSQGRTNAEIAAALGISLATTKRHLNNIMIKWNCANRTQVAVETIRRQATADVPSIPAGHSASADPPLRSWSPVAAERSSR